MVGYIKKKKKSAPFGLSLFRQHVASLTLTKPQKLTNCLQTIINTTRYKKSKGTASISISTYRTQSIMSTREAKCCLLYRQNYTLVAFLVMKKKRQFPNIALLYTKINK